MIVTYNSITYDSQYPCFTGVMKNKRKQYKDAVIEILFVIRGNAEITIDDETYKVNTGEFIFISHGTPFCKSFPSKEKTKVIRMVFWNNNKKYWRDTYRTEIKKIFKNFPRVMPITKGIEKLINSVETIIPNTQLFHNAGTSRQLVFMSIGDALLELISLMYNKKQTNLYKKDLHPLAVKGLEFINTMCYEDISLDDIAQNLLISKRQVLNIFKDSKLDSPIKCLWNRRVVEALDLLQHSNMSIKEIAKNTGFKSLSHFHRKIKTETGKSPKEIVNS